MNFLRKPATLGALGVSLLTTAAAPAQQAKTKTAAPPASAPADAPKTVGQPVQDPAPKPADTSGAFANIAALNEHYDSQFRDVDRRRIADLASLAGRLQGPEAEGAYQAAFNLAITRDLYEAAEPGADKVIETGKVSPQTLALASFVKIVGQVQRGHYDPAVQGLDRFLKAQGADSSAADRKLDPTLVLAVGEATLQHLIRAGQYDAARKAAAMLAGGLPDPTVKTHFASRQARLDMLGKPAPAIAGNDIEGKPFDPAEMKGKVTLVTFWATWCPPCVAEVPHYNALVAKYGKQGFNVVGVNVDSAHEGARGDASKNVAPQVRQFLLSYRVGWPNVMNSSGQAGDLARAYGVADIPATFLVGRDGTILDVEASGPELDKAVERALKGDKDKDAPATKAASR